MRALSVCGVLLVLGMNAPLEGQVEIFSDNLESGATGAWSLDFSLCPQFFGGRTIAGHCYRWMEESGDWYESQRQCSLWAPGAELISVESHSEWNFLLLNLEPTGFDSWIGLSRGNREECPGDWTWESNDPVAFTDWNSGQPDAAACPACAASWSSLDQRWDDLACSASGAVSDSICEVDLTDVRIIGRNGGRLTFPNGAILDVPANAVDDNTAIGVRSIDCSELDPILNARPINSHDKECLAGIDITPSDLTFAEPAILTLPYANREADEFPVLLEVFPEDSDYAYRPTDLIHDPATESLTVEISMAAEYAIAILSESPATPPPPGPTDQSPEVLCEEGRIGVRSEFVDLDVAHGDVECTLLFDSVSVTFLDCVGAPEFVHEMAESVGCSEDTYFRGRICGPGVSGEECFADPQPVTYVESEGTVQLHVWAEAIDPQQGNDRLFIANIDVATYQWQTLDYSMGRFPDPSTGLLQAEECPQDTCQFGVQALNRYASLPKGTVEVVTTLFDVEWYYSWASDESCRLSGEGWYTDVQERYSGGWGGTATFLIPDYYESEVLSYEPEGAIQYRRDWDKHEACDEPPRWETLTGIEQQTWLPESPCPEHHGAALEILENEEQANFWACIPLNHEFYEYRSGRTCSGPLNVSNTSMRQGTICIFPLWVELTHQGDGVFEIDETLLLEPVCDPHACTTQVPVTVYVRAVYRQTP